MKEQSEFEEFDSAMDELLRVARNAIKAKLDDLVLVTLLIAGEGS